MLPGPVRLADLNTLINAGTAVAMTVLTRRPPEPVAPAPPAPEPGVRRIPRTAATLTDR